MLVTITTAAFEEAGTIAADVSSNRNEFDAARNVMRGYLRGVPVHKDNISVLLGYIRRQYAQDRYGK